jgi:3-deoxy-D-manno-octulosonic acid kinase
MRVVSHPTGSPQTPRDPHSMSWQALYTEDPALADYAVHPRPGERILLHRAYADRARDLGLAGSDARAIGEVLGGREAHPILELPGGERVVSRRYRRGGAVRHLNRARYFAGHRALRELRATARARAGGVRAPLVIAAVERPQRIGYTAALLTRLVPDAQELASWLEAAAPEGRAGVLGAVGAQIAAMHEAGVAHPDLNLRNFLVSGSSVAPEVWIIDFDRAQALDVRVPSWRRARDLLRLGRSIRKLRAPIGESGQEALRAGYGSDWPLRSLLG